MIPAVIRNALATGANNVSGTLSDVEHFVIFMQENRSFDRYYGTLPGCAILPNMGSLNDPTKDNINATVTALAPNRRTYALTACPIPARFGHPAPYRRHGRPPRPQRNRERLLRQLGIRTGLPRRHRAAAELELALRERDRHLGKRRRDGPECR
jgi:hypothetical protein